MDPLSRGPPYAKEFFQEGTLLYRECFTQEEFFYRGMLLREFLLQGVPYRPGWSRGTTLLFD